MVVHLLQCLKCISKMEMGFVQNPVCELVVELWQWVYHLEWFCRNNKTWDLKIENSRSEWERNLTYSSEAESCVTSANFWTPPGTSRFGKEENKNPRVWFQRGLMDLSLGFLFLPFLFYFITSFYSFSFFQNILIILGEFHNL